MAAAPVQEEFTTDAAESAPHETVDRTKRKRAVAKPTAAKS